VLEWLVAGAWLAGGLLVLEQRGELVLVEGFGEVVALPVVATQLAETLELGRVQGADKAKQYYRIINKESQRLTQLINNILDFSRIEAGRKEYRLVPSDIAAVVRDVVESYRFAIEKLGFTLELELGEEELTALRRAAEGIRAKCADLTALG